MNQPVFVSEEDGVLVIIHAGWKAENISVQRSQVVVHHVFGRNIKTTKFLMHYESS